jgi:hypothetical protein
MMPTLQFHVDAPTGTPLHAFFAVRGWVASSHPVLQIFAGDPAANRTLAFLDRPDVRAAMRNHAHATGFVGQACADDIVSGALQLTVRTAAGDERVGWPLRPPLIAAAPPPPDVPVTDEMKAEKIRRLSGRLACTACKAPLRELEPRCPACGATFEFSTTMLDCMSPAQRATVPAVGEMRDSLGGYDEVMHALVQRYAGGLILDCGAGAKSRIYPNVINLEIMAYSGTDVRAFNESLPFTDGTFDAVFSLATLEHVRDPFASGREIMRVLRPGGLVYSMVPLMEPFHGYPNHFYNMTVEGHKNVFGPTYEPLDASVPLSGNAMHALSGLLLAWQRGLAAPAQAEFLNLRIGDLLGAPDDYANRDFVRHLHPDVAMNIAAMTCLLGRKRA